MNQQSSEDVEVPSTKRLRRELKVGDSEKASVEIIRPQPKTSEQYVREAIAHARSKVTLLVNMNQFANPMLRHIRHVSKESRTGLVADFVCGPTTSVLYLSLQYHKLHPTYIYKRVSGLGRKFRLRILLILIDVADHRESLHELSRLALLQQLTLICTGSEREAARYLETLRSYDTKGTESIQERVNNDYASRLNAALSSIRGVNRTDISTLAFTFGSVRSIAAASQDDLRKCPGFGQRKVHRLFTALHQPFRKDQAWSGLTNTYDDDTTIDDDPLLE